MLTCKYDTLPVLKHVTNCCKHADFQFSTVWSHHMVPPQGVGGRGGGLKHVALLQTCTVSIFNFQTARVGEWGSNTMLLCCKHAPSFNLSIPGVRWVGGLTFCSVYVQSFSQWTFPGWILYVSMIWEWDVWYVHWFLNQIVTFYTICVWPLGLALLSTELIYLMMKWNLGINCLTCKKYIKYLKVCSTRVRI